jgi:hypothetical protein
MAARKTFYVESVKNSVNESLRCSDGIGSEIVARRQGMMNVLENILHGSGNYSGYRYLLAHEVPAGALPGVNYDVNERGVMVPHPDYEKRFANTDKTRVHYF